MYGSAVIMGKGETEKFLTWAKFPLRHNAKIKHSNKYLIIDIIIYNNDTFFAIKQQI
jgi:hypothetical protein